MTDKKTEDTLTPADLAIAGSQSMTDEERYMKARALKEADLAKIAHLNLKRMNEKREGRAILKFFEYAHLPDSLKAVSKPFGEMAKELVATLPDNTERVFALRKLLEAKDCAVRARLAE